MGGGRGTAGGGIRHETAGTLLGAGLGVRLGGGVALAVVALEDALAVGITGGVLPVAVPHHLRVGVGRVR